MQLGWLAAAGLAGILLAGGFQPAADKFAMVDISQVIEKSEYGKANQNTFNDMKAARESLLEFIDANRVLTIDQAKQLKDLSLKDKPTAADKAALEKLKADIKAEKDKSEQLAQKANPTDEEKALIREYGNRATNADGMARQLYQGFSQEMQKWWDDQKAVSIDRARAAIADAAKAQGYTVVYEVGVVPYCSNDLTDAALKAMNAKKP